MHGGVWVQDISIADAFEGGDRARFSSVWSRAEDSIEILVGIQSAEDEAVEQPCRGYQNIAQALVAFALRGAE